MTTRLSSPKVFALFGLPVRRDAEHPKEYSVEIARFFAVVKKAGLRNRSAGPVAFTAHYDWS